jgi:hypothetical protein
MRFHVRFHVCTGETIADTKSHAKSHLQFGKKKIESDSCQTQNFLAKMWALKVDSLIFLVSKMSAFCLRPTAKLSAQGLESTF